MPANEAMDTALFRLLTLRFWAGIRQRLRYIKTLRGLLLSLMSVAVAAFFIQQAVQPGATLASVLPASSVPLQGQIDNFLPLGMLATFLLTVALAPKPALYFNPAEINLLFGGPFTRRSLVLYKLTAYAFGALLSSALIVLLMPALSYAPLAAFLGTFLTLAFIQLLTVATGLSCQLLASRFDIRRWPFLTFVALITAAVGYYFIEAVSLSVALAQFQSSPVGLLLLAPFQLFAHIVRAGAPFADLLPWIVLGFAINSGLVAAIVRLDLKTFALSADSSLKLHERWDRARRSGKMWSARVDVVRSCPPAPRLGGIGPIAWRQWLSAWRSSRNVLLVLLILAIVAGPLWATVSAEMPLWPLLGGVFFIAVFVLSKTLVFDFRSDLEIIEIFKSMPLSSWKLVIGELAVPVALASLIEAVFLAGMAITEQTGSKIVIVAIGANLLPFNLLLFGLENLFFLLFPAPLVPVGRADFDFLGRTLVEFVIKSTLLIAIGLLAIHAGLQTMAVTGWPWASLVLAAFVTLLLVVLIVLSLLSFAFKRFDPAR